MEEGGRRRRKEELGGPTQLELAPNAPSSPRQPASTKSRRTEALLLPLSGARGSPRAPERGRQCEVYNMMSKGETNAER